MQSLALHGILVRWGLRFITGMWWLGLLNHRCLYTHFNMNNENLPIYLQHLPQPLDSMVGELGKSKSV